MEWGAGSGDPLGPWIPRRPPHPTLAAGGVPGPNGPSTPHSHGLNTLSKLIFVGLLTPLTRCIFVFLLTPSEHAHFRQHFTYFGVLTPLELGHFT